MNVTPLRHRDARLLVPLLATAFVGGAVDTTRLSKSFRLGMMLGCRPLSPIC